MLCDTNYNRFAEASLMRTRNVITPQRKKTYSWTSAPSKYSNQIAHLRNLMRNFTGHFLDSQRCKVSSCGQQRLWSNCADMQVDLNIGIKHGFSCINIRQVPWEVLKTEAEGRGFQHLSRDLANVSALKNHIRSLLMHKNWKRLLHFALFFALFCFAFSPMSRERNFH